MKKIKEIIGFDNLYVYKNSIIVRNKNSIQLVDENLDLKPLLEENIYSTNILNGSLYYQLNDGFNIHVLTNEHLKEPYQGIWDVSFAIEYMDYVYIYSNFENEDAYYLLDENLNVFNKINAKCNYSYAKNLFRTGLNNVICYEMNEKRWHYKHSDNSMTRIISGYKDKVLVYSESGDFFALSLDNGNVVWKYPKNCHHPNSLYEDFLYTLNKNKLLEINAETGQMEREMDIQKLRDKEHFFAIAGIKAYDDYIFGKDVDGAIAIIDRKSLTLKEVIRFEHHLGNWTFPFIWLNNRLYVQDVEYTIHVFE